MLDHNLLERRAEKFGLMIRKHERGKDSYMLVDVRLNAVAAPAPMTLKQIRIWLLGLEKSKSNARFYYKLRQAVKRLTDKATKAEAENE